MRVVDLQALRIRLASPEDIAKWSYGEVTKPETINYRTQKAEKDGLFDERIFGPEKDYECYCGKYRKIRYKGVVCDRCQVEVTKASVRRERMGHIKLATPCSHIWFLRGVPSRIGLVLDLPAQQLERVIYFASYIVTGVHEERRAEALEEIEAEFKRKARGAGTEDKQELKGLRDRERDQLKSLAPLGVLSEVDYQHMALKYGHVFEAGTGAETLRALFEQVNLDKEISRAELEAEKATPQNRKRILGRLRLLRGMKAGSVRPEWMFLTHLPVLPPDLRPMVQLDGGRYASSDLNDLYRRVINRNNRLKYLLELGAPEVIVRNEKRMLQEAVDALVDNSMRKGQLTQATTGGRRLLKSLADMLKGKQGRFRQNLLGKRVDYSGRSVIVAGPKLRLHQVGLPKRMALELFKPFVIQKILEQEFAYNVRGASRLIEQETDEVWAILEEVVQGRLVLLNRAPTLHRLGIQAFTPLLIEGEAIQLHPLVCPAFNADFDGDQMAVHVPLSQEAQQEAADLMLSTQNMLKPATGNPIVAPRQDMVLGCYWLTDMQEAAPGKKKAFGHPNEALLAYENGAVELQEAISCRLPKNWGGDGAELVETTAGRLIFNDSLPPGYPFVNEQMSAKKMEGIAGNVIRNYDTGQAEDFLDRVKALGFEYATKSGVTWGMDDLVVPKEKARLLEEAKAELGEVNSHFEKGLLSGEERSAKVIEVWSRVKQQVEKLVPQVLPSKGSVSTIIDSGSRGSWSQPVQMAGMKGLVINPAGRIIELPVTSSFKEGFDVLEYFISTHGARKGTADTALRTSTAGYLTRRLIDVAHELLIMEKDCKDTQGIEVFKAEAEEMGQSIALKLAGRVLAEAVPGFAKKGEVVDADLARRIGEDERVLTVRVRSPLSCRAQRGLCQACYGWDLGQNEPVRMGAAVGIVAAQSIGEPGTQLTMRTFHTGGVAGGGDITQGLPRVEEIFEARAPSGKAVLAESAGRVEEAAAGSVKIRVLAKTQGGKEETAAYAIPPGRALWVQAGDLVTEGQQLCEGHLDLEELFKAAGKEAVQRYIVREVQRIYATQGASIHDKHLEVITRQLFSRMRVKSKGGTKLSEGDVVDRSTFLEASAEAKKAGKEPATAAQLLLGISRVALTTESFLSAASFQETSRILIRASLEGKEDKLRGLKENVIIGKLIPAGTGFAESA